MIQVFKKQGVKPKANTPEDFEGWLNGFATMNVGPSPEEEPSAGVANSNANEVEIKIEGVKVRALLDTGATVSILSRTFYNEHLEHIPIAQH